MPTDKIRILILFLTYGDRYKGSLEKFLEICRQIGLEKRLIIIRNDSENLHIKQLNDWTFEMGGDNSVFEFSGWQKAIDSEIAHSFVPDVYLIANDAFLATGLANSFYALPVLDEEIIRIVYEKKLLAGRKLNYSVKGLDSFIQTHFFLISAEIIKKIGSIVSENLSEKFLKSEYSADVFTESKILGEPLKKFIYYTLTQRWHNKGLKLSSQNYNNFKRKVLCAINEILLSNRIEKLNYKIVDLTPFHSLFNSFYILPVPFRPVILFQFIRRIIFFIFYILFHNAYSKKIGLEKWFAEMRISNVKNRLSKK